MTLLAWCAAFLLDRLLGDPPHWPHPVRWIGALITHIQRGVRQCCHSDVALRIGGGVMWLLVVGITPGGELGRADVCDDGPSVVGLVCAGVGNLHHAGDALPWRIWRGMWKTRCAVVRSATAAKNCRGLSGATRRNCNHRRSPARWWKPWRKTPSTA